MRNTILEALSDNIVIDKDKCVYCGECVNTCILDNLRMKLAPCRQACPLGVNCQGYVQLILRGEKDQALEMVERNLPFPSILGRVCSAQCETACHRGKAGDSPVAIRALKRYVADAMEDKEFPLPDMAEATGKHCAVVGAGPAGMLAAWDLMVRGHQVTLIDGESAPGGMLRWAIPSFRLPGHILEKEFARLEAMGAIIKCGVRLGEDLAVADLASEYDAVVVATGCPGTRKLGIKGETLDGVYPALDFLKDVRGGGTPAVGEKVVVIGGGDVAVDSAQTALRLGASSVTVVSLEGDDAMPASQEALEMAFAEGVKFEGAWGPTRILEQEGRVAGVELQRCLSVFDASGKFAPSFDDCTLKDLDADTVIVAIGQARDLSVFDNGGVFKFNELTQQTETETVFVAGDVVTGPATIVEAMASGRTAAESVHRLFTGEHMTYGRQYEGPVEKEFDIDTTRGSDARRVKPEWRIPETKKDFKEVEQVMSYDQACTEAGRCYSCGTPFGKYRTCWFCLPCEVECPKEALWVEIPYLLR